MPVWQRYLAEHPDLNLLSVAADMGGADLARPWLERAGATFPTLLDAENILGRLYDYKVIPNAFFINEEGILVGKWISFYPDRPECAAAVDAFRAGTLEPFERLPAPAAGTPTPVRESAGLSPVERKLYETRIRLGTALRAAGKDEEAATEWHKALMMDPGNFVLRKQVWMLRNPDKFYPEIDYPWQQAQLAREREEEAALFAAECGPEGCALPSR